MPPWLWKGFPWCLTFQEAGTAHHCRLVHPWKGEVVGLEREETLPNYSQSMISGLEGTWRSSTLMWAFSTMRPWDAGSVSDLLNTSQTTDPEHPAWAIHSTESWPLLTPWEGVGDLALGPGYRMALGLFDHKVLLEGAKLIMLIWVVLPWPCDHTSNIIVLGAIGGTFSNFFGIGEVEGKGLVLEEEKERENKYEKSSPGISTYSILCGFTLSLHMVSLS